MGIGERGGYFPAFHGVVLHGSKVASLFASPCFLFTMFLASKLSLGLRGWVPPAPNSEPVSRPSAALPAKKKTTSNEDGKITLLKIK